jgi:hypothetical protein
LRPVVFNNDTEMTMTLMHELPVSRDRRTGPRRAGLLLAVALATASGAAAQAPQGAAPLAGGLTFRASGPSPFAAGCDGVPPSGEVFINSEVEPFVAVNPRHPLNLVAAWQQDRWSDGGAQGLGTGYSFDGGITWRRVFVPFSRCAGGNAANNGDWERATDPWVSFSPNGVVHLMSLSFSNTVAADQPASAMLASRSLDGGRTWSTPVTLVADTPDLFNDKNTITADPTDSRFVYATWDRLDFNPDTQDVGPALFARSVDNGRSWEPTRVIFSTGPNAQTIGNRIEVLPDGTLVNLFTFIDFITGEVSAQVIRSRDKGLTWSPAIKVADMLGLGTADPETGTPIRDGAILAQLAVNPRNGAIHVVWQDSRFSGFERDGVALSTSVDGGLTWSDPVQINRDPLVQAFLPAVHVRFDGTIGVTYHDLRSNTADAATLPTDTWLIRSRDGGNTWRESRVSRPFNLAKAPFAGGLFVGDYQGLASIGPVFVPFFVKTTDGPDLQNRTDAFSHLALAGIAAAVHDREALTRRLDREDEALPTYSVQGTGRAAAAVPAALRERSMQAVQRALRARVPRWDERVQRRLVR